MSDEELIDYTDPDIIARQNIAPNAGCNIDGKFYDVRNLVHLASSQADRIEALTKERDEAVHLARMRKTFTEEARDERDAAAAKLAKAVEIGNKMAHSIEGNYYLPNIAGEWRKVAAEIKGESHE